jgi:predicted glycogen debranching enzyme
MDTTIRDAEWLETDGLGGFASGTIAGPRTRRYHALLLAATRPPTGRFALVNGFDAEITTGAGTTPLAMQRYTPGVVHPTDAATPAVFTDEPWPTWTFRLGDGTTIVQEICVARGAPIVTLSFRRTAGSGPARLTLRLFLSGRDYHALHHENAAFRFEAEAPVPATAGDGTAPAPGSILWRPYQGVPAIAALHNGFYEEAPEWYRGFLYEEERARGLDHVEDLASPGVLTFDLESGEAALVLSVAGAPVPPGGAARALAHLREAERRRRLAYPSRLHRAADDYIVKRGDGATIVAGYPWFADWGRDTFIAMRGLCLATGRLDAARDILVEWAGAVSSGMLPNRFPDQGDEPEFNAVDAALWYVVAVHEYLHAAASAGRFVPDGDRRRLAGAVAAIVAGYAAGTRYGIRMDDDGLLAAGVEGVQLTWMDARVGDRVVTPRIGKPVEIQALWVNALRIAADLAREIAGATGSGVAAADALPDWRAAAASFNHRFRHPEGWLFDVVDVDHRPGTVDATFRPNQIFAVGGLPYPLLDGAATLRVVNAVEARLLTPLGLRSLASDEAGYVPRYAGGIAERDGAYHQGTVWPWLLGPFVEAWVRARGGTADARTEARRRFLLPLTAHLATAGIGHASEVADAEAPHRPGGCPFQAWSVGELLRLSEWVLAPAPRSAARATRRESRARARASVSV